MTRTGVNSAGAATGAAVPCKLCEEYCEILREVRWGGGEGARKRPSCRGRWVDQDYLSAVDSLITDLWEETDRSVWQLEDYG